MWTTFRVVAAALGAGQWSISVGGSPQAWALGPNIDPAVVAAPAQNVVVSVTGAQPNTQVTGTLEGVAGASFEEIAPHVSVAPNAISVQTQAPTILLGTATAVGGGVGGTVTVPVPPNAYGLVLLPEIFGIAAQINSLSVQGVTSNDFYLNVLGFPGSGMPPQPIYVSLGTQTKDSQITVAFGVTAGAGQPAIDVIALLAPIATATVITGIGVSSIANGQQDTHHNANASIPVVPAEFYTPAPWQAPAFDFGINAVSVNSGAAAVIIAPSALQTVYLHRYSFSQDAANAASHWTLTDNSAVVLGDFFDAAVRHVFAQGDFGGAPITSGRGVQMVNNGAAASFLGGYLTASQI